MYLLLAFAYLYTAWTVPTLIPLPTIINIVLSINNSYFISVFSNQACHANPVADRKWAGSSYISIHLFLKFSNTSASNDLSLWTYKSWYLPRFFILNSLDTFWACM